jgi:hypothetical protein
MSITGNCAVCEATHQTGASTTIDNIDAFFGQNIAKTISRFQKYGSAMIT